MDIRIVDGNLVKDAEIKTSKSGTKYLSFTLANNAYVNQERIAVYFNVVSYDGRLIERQSGENKPFTKGKAVVVTGKSSENMTVRDGKAYLNRNIIAINIETHSFGQKKETETTYHDVAPVYESPRAPQPVASAPSVQVPTYGSPRVNESVRANPIIDAPVIPTPTPAPVPAPVVMASAPSANVDDDLPF